MNLTKLQLLLNFKRQAVAVRLYSIKSDSMVQRIPLCAIDKGGDFKYILIRHMMDQTLYLRGSKKFMMHKEILNDFLKEYSGSKNESSHNDTYECIGGGRITVDPSQQLLTVYSYSQGYGRADHKQAKSLLEKELGYKVEIGDPDVYK